MGEARASDKARAQPWSVISTGRRVESFADDLNTRRGIVSGRVALLPRSTEIQPFVASIRPSPSTISIFRGENSGVERYYTVS